MNMEQKQNTTVQAIVPKSTETEKNDGLYKIINLLIGILCET